MVDGWRGRSSSSKAPTSAWAYCVQAFIGVGLSGAAWLGASELWQLHATVGPPAQTVNLRWAPGVSSVDRQRAEAELGLAEARENSGEQGPTRTYRLSRRSTSDIQRIVSNPMVEDTYHIDRVALRVELDQAQMNPWLRRLLETDQAPLICWILVASGVLSLWSFRRAIGYLSMRAVRFLWAAAAVARALATARRMATVAAGFLWAAVTDRGAEAQDSGGVAADMPVGVISPTAHGPWSTAGSDFPLGALELLRCPSCEAAIMATPDHVACRACGTTYPVTGGILDLRSSALDAHKQRQNAFFSDQAEGYERDVVNAPFYQALDALTVGRWTSGLPSGACVLDIGTGTGRVAIALAQRGHRVIAMDLTAPLLYQARQKALDAGVAHRIAFVLADAEALPIADGTLDGAVAHGVLHHLEHPEAVVARAGRSLRPGGYWFSLDPHRSPVRWIFDAAMRWKTLWQEEAAPDGLQTAERLCGWCRAAGIEPAVGYSVYVLPHLLSSLPRRGIERALAISDAIFSRSVVRRCGGVVYVCGRRRPVAATATAGFPHGAVLAALIALAAMSGLWRTDPSVAAQSDHYYMGGMASMLGAAQLAGRMGATMLTPGGEPIETRSLDDVGYMLALQGATVIGIPVTAAGLAKVHALAFTIAAILFAWAVGARYGSPVTALVVLAALAALGTHLSVLIYGQVSNQTATSVFPPLVLAALIVWSPRLGQVSTLNAVLALRSAALGALVGAVDLVRHSHGLAVMLTLFVVVAISVRGLQARVGIGAALTIGYVAATMIMPAVAKVQRDVHLNRWNGWSWVYLQRPPAHHLSYTLLTAVGRYPNALGLYYEDRAVDEYIIKRTPRPLNEAGRVDAARGLFFEYVRAHPREYVGTLARGAGELGPFLAYTTFMAPKRWFGWPEVVPGVDPDPRDVARYGHDQLMNVQGRYLRLRPWQWVLFGLALTMVGFTALGALWGLGRGGGTADVTMVAALVYLAWVAAPRALIPVQGMDFVFAFWCVALLAAAHVMLSGPRPPLTARSSSRSVP
jgi:ubiquinone/menaquinone biosynthesis C-methylase UbiE